MDNTQITDPLTKKMFHSYIDEILIYYHKELQSDPNSIKRIRNGCKNILLIKAIIKKENTLVYLAHKI